MKARKKKDKPLKSCQWDEDATCSVKRRCMEKECLRCSQMIMYDLEAKQTWPATIGIFTN